MTLLEQLQAEYGQAGFAKSETTESFVFSKSYQFEDSDSQKREVLIEVIFSKEYPLIPPLLHDPCHVLSSMHSLNGFQCWARFSDIFPQLGLGLIAPNLVENQIQKLIEAHKNSEYYTIYESPEFASIFEARDTVDHTQFYVNCEVLNEVVRAGTGKIIHSVADTSDKQLYGVTETPTAVDASSQILPPTKHNGKKRSVFFLNVPAILHYGCCHDDIQFLYWLEKASGISQKDMFLQNIQEEIFIVLVFFNDGIKHHDIVVFYKKNNKILLVKHARVSSLSVLFNRHTNEYLQLTKKNVAIIGIGAIGSLLGMCLLQSGIFSLHVVDNDYVDLENISRSIYCAADVGKKKTDAFKRRAGLKEPDFSHRVLIYESIDSLLKHSIDLFIICIGDIYFEYKISRDMRKAGFEKNVFVFGQNDSTWGGIYFQDDAKLGCQHCLLLHQNVQQELKIPYVPYFSDAVGCGKPSYISTPTDIGLIANLASKLIIERLIRQQKTGPNYFIWQSNPEPVAWRDTHTDRYSLQKYRVGKHAKCEC